MRTRPCLGPRSPPEPTMNLKTPYSRVGAMPLALGEREFLMPEAATSPFHTFTPTGSATQEVFVGTDVDDEFNGTFEDDSFDLSTGGNDRAYGREGDDLFMFGGSFGNHDRVYGGSNGSNGDVLQLAGDYGRNTTFFAAT